MGLSVGDAVTYVGLLAVAVMEAADGARKEAAMPADLHPFLASHYWSYAPIIIMTLVGLIWLYKVVFTSAISDFGKRLTSGRVKNRLITNKVFKHTEVLLDNHSYMHCKFENVTLKYNGTGYTSFQFNQINGVQISSDSQVVKAAWALAFNSGFMKPETVDTIDETVFSLPYTPGFPPTDH
jgi:hypothetical protein